jgi:hypothetical protein
MKKIFYTFLLISPLLFISSCEEEYENAYHGCLDSQACNYNPAATIDNNSCEYPQIGYDCDYNVITQIGDTIQGGIVFQINENGSGLVAAMEDLPDYYEWGPAVTEASNYSSEGYTGWHLPSIGELELMYNMIGQGVDNIGGFEDGVYWSSSGTLGGSEMQAWWAYFGNGINIDYGYHWTSYRVRPIRSF